MTDATKGKWAALLEAEAEEFWYADGYWELGPVGHLFVTLPPGRSDEARLIVAAVNAVQAAGLSVEALEAGVVEGLVSVCAAAVLETRRVWVISPEVEAVLQAKIGAEAQP